MPNPNESRGRTVKRLGIILSVLLLGVGFIEARVSEQTIQVEYKPNTKVK